MILKKIITKEKCLNFLYLMTVGLMLSWVMTSGVIDTTILERNHMLNLMRLFLMVGFFGLLFCHKYLRRFGLVIGILLLVLFISGFIMTPNEPNLLTDFAELVQNSLQFIFGNRGHTQTYETLITWFLILLFSLFVVIFLYYKFYFWILFPTSAVTTGLAITSPYFQHEFIFHVYIFCLLALVTRYLHEKNMSHVAKKPATGIFSQGVVVLVAIIVVISQVMPSPTAGSADGFIRTFIRTPFDVFNDLFLDLTQQSEFSLRQVGFSSGSQMLGGNIEPNDHVFMEIIDQTFMMGPLYLTGATRDTYTGYAWTNTQIYAEEVDFLAMNHLLEFIETGLRRSFYWQYTTLRQLNDIGIENMILRDSDEFFDPDDEWQQQIRIFTDPAFELWVHAFTESDGENFISLHMNAMDEHWLEIDNLDRRLTTVFHSGIVSNVTLETRDLSLLRSSEGNFFTSARMNHRTGYRVQFLTGNEESDYSLIAHQTVDGWMMEPFHRANISYHGFLADLSETIETFRAIHGYTLWGEYLIFGDHTMTFENLLNDYLIPRVNDIHLRYTTLPDEFPERVKLLAYDVTQTGETNFEKMTLLQQFLTDNFAYTLTPGPSPNDRDFVDHFLFDIQRGYCVHFATAFVTMARSLGMPARYVEGFYVQTHERRNIEVLNNMAHAWPEVYFEGFGWLRFEPTPAAGLPSAVDVTASAPVGNWSAPDWLDYMQNEHMPGQSGEIENNHTQPNLEANENQSTFPFIPVISGFLTVIMVVILRILYVLIKHRKKAHHDHKINVINQFETLLAYLKLLGFEINENETVLQYAHRIDQFSVFHLDNELLKSSVDAFSKARFSQQEINKEDWACIEKLINRLDKRLKYRLGKIKYLFYRYILAKM